MSIRSPFLLACLLTTTLTSCAGAAFNRVEFTLERNFSVGRELMDLKEAHNLGILTDAEYLQAKEEILELVSALNEMQDID